MKKLIFTTSFFLFSIGFCLAQTNEKLLEFNKKRLDINKIGLFTLGTWAIANIGTNLLLQRNALGETKSFEQMNIYWNIFNAGLAGFGYFSALHADPNGNFFTTMQEQSSLEKTFLLNTGLDVAYVAGGFWLIEKGKNTVAPDKADRFTGFGKSVILQGAFLFLFDLTMYGIHHHHLNSHKNIFENIQLSSNGVGVMWKI